MEILFCFVQEELRELHEEPTDPQAQQEIINSIEEVYFSNDSFDIVKYELEVSCHHKRRNGNITKMKTKSMLVSVSCFYFIDLALI